MLQSIETVRREFYFVFRDRLSDVSSESDRDAFGRRFLEFQHGRGIENAVFVAGFPFEDLYDSVIFPLAISVHSNKTRLRGCLNYYVTLR